MLFWGCFTLSTYAQVTNGVGTRQIGFGGCSGAIVNAWAIKNNPGAWAKQSGTTVGIAAHNRYNLKQITSHDLIVSHHKKWGNIGGYLQYAGFNLHHQIQCSGAFAKVLTDHVGLGVNFNYHWVGFGDIYGYRHSISGSLGLHYTVSKALRFGVVIQNVDGRHTLEKQTVNPPTLFKLSTLYALSDQVHFLLELEQSLLGALNLKSGIEINELERYAFRAGLNTNPFQSTFGFGLNFKRLAFDLGAMWHVQLGLLSSIGIEYNIE